MYICACSYNHVACTCVGLLAAPPGYPIINENPMLKAVERGRNAVLQCSATGDPPPNIYWLKDFIPVDLSDERITLLDRGECRDS